MRAHEDDAPQIGRRFGDFVAVRRLGAGGMAEVYLGARADREDVELVAIKRLLPHLAWEVEYLRMFLAEAELAGQLHHPNIARVFDCGTAEGGHYLAMEFVHGSNLREILKALDEERLPVDFGVGVVAELADALHYAHEWTSADGQVTGIVHRDVSPSNVMVGAHGEVKLLDFGIARLHGRTQYTRAGTIKGKVGYMSPEQCRGDAADRRSDVFGLGVLLYELCLQQRAFYAENDYGFMGRVLAGDYESARSVDPDFPPELEAIINTCLAVDPAQRYPDARTLRTELVAFAKLRELDLSPAARAKLLGSVTESTPRPHVDRRTLAQLTSAAGPRRRLWPSLPIGLAVGGLGVALGVFIAGRGSAAPAAEPLPSAVAQPHSATVPAATRTDDAPAQPRPAPTPTLEAAPSRPAPLPDSTVPEDASPRTAKPTRTRKRKQRRAESQPAPDDRRSVTIDEKALLPPSLR